MEDIRIPHDIAGPSRADEDQGDILGDERFEKSPPRRPGRGGILVGKVDDFEAVLPVQASQFGGKFDRVPMPPPKPVLSAAMAAVRTTA